MSLKNYFKKAQKEHFALIQFNFCTLEQLKALLEAAKEMKSPLILGTSEGESGYLGLEETVALVEISKAKHNLKIFLNFDHGKDVKKIKKAIDLGYSCVHFDGSGLSLEENAQITKKLADYAHKKGVLIEGELGAIKGESVIHFKKPDIIKEKYLTSSDQAAWFVKKTGVDSLAVSVGNLHGIYKNPIRINLQRLREIKEKTDVFLVLHGASGTSLLDIKKAIKIGVVKININTEIRKIWREGLVSLLKKKKNEIKPYKILPFVSDLIKKKAEEKIKISGSKGKV